MRYKKLMTICEGVNKKILNLLDNAIRTSTDVQAINILQNLYADLKTQQISLSVEWFEDNVKIYKYLQEICDDLANKYYTVANCRIKKLQSQVVVKSRHSGSMLMTKKDLKKDKQAEKAIAEYAKKGGFNLEKRVSVTDLYQDEDLYELMVAQLQDESNKLSSEIEQLTNSSASQFSEYKKEQFEYKFSEINQKLEKYCKEGNRNAYLKAMSNVTEEVKELISKREYGAEQAKVMEEQYNAVMQNYDAEADTLSPGMVAFKNRGKSNSTSTISNVNEKTAGEAEQSKKIDTAIKFAVQEQKNCLEKLDELKVKIQDVELKLRMLLQAREDQTAAECEIDDAKIIAAAGEREGLLIEIKKQNQLLSQLTKQLIMFKSNQSLAEDSKRTEQLGSILGINVGQVAVSLDELIKKGNEKKQEVDDAYMAAFNTDIETDSINASSVLNTDNSSGKNIGRFDNLRMQLNMGKAEK